MNQNYLDFSDAKSGKPWHPALPYLAAVALSLMMARVLWGLLVSKGSIFGPQHGAEVYGNFEYLVWVTLILAVYIAIHDGPPWFQLGRKAGLVFVGLFVVTLSVLGVMSAG